MDENRTHLLNALTYAQTKKDNKIVIFQYNHPKDQEQNTFPWNREKKAHDHLQQQIQECCGKEFANDVCFKSCSSENMSTEMEKTIIYTSQLKLPINHNDNDLYQLKAHLDKLKENQNQIRFIIATDNEKSRDDLTGYLKRQYKDSVIAYFPTKNNSFFTQPLVIVGGIVTIVGLCYWFFKNSLSVFSSKA